MKVKMIHCFLAENMPIEVEPGIFQDRSLGVALGMQSDELKHRDMISNVLHQSDEELIEQATQHHCAPVMKTRLGQLLQESGLLDPSDQSRVIVDLGSGWGWCWKPWIAQLRGVTVVLTDFSLNSLRVARKLFPYQEYPNVICLQADASALPLSSKSVSAVWSVQVLQHLSREKRQRAFSEITRILDPKRPRFYLAWLNRASLMQFAYHLRKKPYIVQGDAGGFYIQRFDDEVFEDARSLLPAFRKEYSEVVFQPELGLKPKSKWVSGFDRSLSKVPGAHWLARQVALTSVR